MSRAIRILALLLLAHVPPARSAIVVRGGAGPSPWAARSVTGRVLVVDDAGVFHLDPGGRLRAGPARLAGLLERHGLANATTLTHGAPGTRRFLSLESSRADFDPAQVAAELRASGLVRAAVPDLKLELHVIPNDPYAGSQWYLDDGGFADVRLAAAWDVEKGSAAARIGVMDTGVDTGHPDLASKIWTNPGEIPANGTDDDGNGYVDDVHGWDFGDGDDDPNPHPVPDEAAFGVDVGFHGTFVAGVAAAATDNAEGIAGAGWNCRVVPLKVVNSAAEITLSAMTEAFAYATAMHLEVLNMSLGIADQPGVPEYFQALVDAATAGGVLCVASAGNDGTDALNYPAACDGVLSIAATNDANDRSSFSNFGATVDLAAPGEAMWSAICRNYLLDEFSQLFYEVFFGWDGTSPYMGGDGTSFSAPLVSGVAALVRSRHPTWSPAVVAAHLVATGDVVGYDEFIGRKLNAHRAVSDASLAVPDPGVGASTLALTNCHLTAPDRLSVTVATPEAGSATVEVLDLQGRRLGHEALSPAKAGEQVVTVPLARAPAPGLCMVHLRQGARTAWRKLLVVR